MHVAFIVSQFPSVSETFILSQLVGLLEDGHDVDVYADGSLKPEATIHADVTKYNLQEATAYSPSMPFNRILRVIKGIGFFAKSCLHSPHRALNSMSIHRFGVMAGSLRVLYSSIPFLKVPEYDIVHCHFGPNGVMSAILQECGFIKSPIITTFYGYDVDKYPPSWNTLGYKPLLNHPSRLLALSEQMKSELVQLGFQESRIFVHHLGVDLDRFVFRPRVLNDGEAIQILSVARFVPKKGLRYAIEAMAIVRRSNLNVKYTIIGDGLLRDEFERLIQDNNLQDIVHLVGWKSQDEVVEHMEKSHLFLAPSVTAEDGDKEGTPTVLIEAMAMGIPIISTKHSGIPEVVPDGKAGYLVGERDADALSEKIVELSSHSERWVEMGKAGREHVEREFEQVRLRRNLVQHYQEAISEHASQDRT